MFFFHSLLAQANKNTPDTALTALAVQSSLHCCGAVRREWPVCLFLSAQPRSRAHGFPRSLVWLWGVSCGGSMGDPLGPNVTSRRATRAGVLNVSSGSPGERLNGVLNISARSNGGYKARPQP